MAHPVEATGGLKELCLEIFAVHTLTPDILLLYPSLSPDSDSVSLPFLHGFVNPLPLDTCWPTTFWKPRQSLAIAGGSLSSPPNQKSKQPLVFAVVFPLFL